jgi:hypothetical protein
MIATACMLGIWLAGKEAERKGLEKKSYRIFPFIPSSAPSLVPVSIM